MENEFSVTATVIEPPRGRFPGRLDDKGRLKLPAGFQAYFATLPERKLFVTSLDRRVAQIYPIQAWRDNEKLLASYREDPEAARSIAFIASDLGAEAEMDAQGRITFNPDLRRELGLEGTELHLEADLTGRVKILTEAMYQERKRRSAEQIARDLDKLERAGLK